MGLGKTVQIAGFLGALAHSGLLRGASLVVVPATVLKQWHREMAKWAPRLACEVFHDSSGRAASVEELRRIVSSFSRQGAGASASADGHEGNVNGCGVVITTYGQLRAKSKSDAFLDQARRLGRAAPNTAIGFTARGKAG